MFRDRERLHSTNPAASVVRRPMNKETILPLCAIATLSACGFERGSTPGLLGRATISYAQCIAKCGIDERAIAAGGAETSVDVESSTPIGRVSSGDVGIARTGSVTSSRAGHYQFPLTSGTPGKVTITFLDATGAEIDGGVFTIAPTHVIGFNSGFGGDSNVITGQKIVLHGNTVGADGDSLVGNGSIHFAYSGVLVKISNPPPWADQEEFAAMSAGDGQATMSAIDAMLMVSIHGIQLSEVDQIDGRDDHVQLAHGQSKNTAYTIRSKGVAIHGSACTWIVDDPSIASVSDLEPDLEQKVSVEVAVKGLAPGHTRASCSVNGSSASFAIDVQ
jgi:hypothetical protein